MGQRSIGRIRSTLLTHTVLLGALWLCLLTSCEAPDIEEYSLSAERQRMIQTQHSSSEEEAIVLLAVGDDLITLSEYFRRQGRLTPLAHTLMNSFGNRRRFLTSIGYIHLLSQQAETLGVDADPNVALSVERAQREAVIQRITTSQLLLSDIHQDAVEERFLASEYRYSRPEMVRLSVAICPDEACAQTVADEYSARRASTFVTNLELFEELVSTHSVHEATGARGGDLGFVSNEQLVELTSADTADIVLELDNLGVISGPHALEDGWGVFFVHQRRFAIAWTLEQVTGEIQQQLYQEQLLVLADLWLEQLRNEGNIEIDEDLVNQLEASRDSSRRRPPLSDLTPSEINDALTPTYNIQDLLPTLTQQTCPECDQEEGTGDLDSTMDLQDD